MQLPPLHRLCAAKPREPRTLAQRESAATGVVLEHDHRFKAGMVENLSEKKRIEWKINMSWGSDPFTVDIFVEGRHSVKIQGTWDGTYFKKTETSFPDPWLEALWRSSTRERRIAAGLSRRPADNMPMWVHVMITEGDGESWPYRACA